MRLNVGAGGQRAAGWTSLDRAGVVDVIHDLTDLPLPFDDASCEAVVAHHVLDLLAPDAMKPTLKEIHRIVARGGWVRISCADIPAGVWAAIVGTAAWFAEPRDTPAATLAHYITQGGARQTPLTPLQAGWLLAHAGFTDVVQTDFRHTSGPDWLTDLDAREAESWFVEARQCG